MKPLVQFLSDLRSLGVMLSLDGERLICNAPKGAITTQIRQELADRKQEILAFLREATPLQASVNGHGALSDLPLSRSQRRLWFLAQMDPGNPVYNVVVALRLTGKLSRTALERSLHALVERHESLRTSFYEREGIPLARVLDGAAWKSAFVDLSSAPEAAAENEARRLAGVRARKPFDLGAQSLVEATLFRISEECHLLLLVVHHIVADGWSLGIISKELGAIYAALAAGKQPELPDIDFQYRDYVRWEQGEGEKAAERQTPFWLERLGGSLPILDLAGDRRRPAKQTFGGKRLAMRIEPLLAGKIYDLCRTAGATPYMLLLAAFKVLLVRYTDIEDVLVGSGTSNRQSQEVAPLVGFFVNTLVMRTDLSGNPAFGELLSRVKETAASTYAHQQIPFDLLVEKLQPVRRVSHSPLVQVMFTFQNLPMEPIVLPNLTVEPEELDPGIARADLSIEVWPDDEGFRCDFEYNTDIYEEETVLQMQRHYLRLLKTVASAPATPIRALSLLNESERSQIVEGWNRTSMPASPSATVAEWLQAQAVKTPAAAAVIYGERTLTYAELDAQSNKLASTLRFHGVARGTVVGVFLHRSPEMVVALLGILKAGGAYLPLDPQLPAQRIEFLIADAAVPLIITQTDLRDTLSDSAAALLMIDQIGESVEQPPTDKPNSEDLAYLIYTSGSTGNPKGTEITHGALVNLLASMLREPGLTSEDTLVAVTTLSFDIAGLEIFGPLVCGATVVVASREQVLDPELLACLLEESAATVMQATPSTWRMLVESGWMGGADLRMWCGGEALRPDLAESLLARGRELWNLYGPTETTIWSAAHRVKSGENPILIGRPIANTRMYILDPEGQPVPVGVPGELYIAGAGVARGYWRRPELTETRFLPDPFDPVSGRRMYRTGDLARYRRDGQIQLIGRTDHQIKLRGHRIELGEIEQALLALPFVRAAIVSTRIWPDGDKRLVAYVAPADGTSLDKQTLRDGLRRVLPSYQIPGSFVTISEVPRTPNGKVDHASLDSLPFDICNDRQNLRPPSTETEKILASIFAELLKAESISAEDDFFVLGGHSLLVMQLISRISASLGVKVSVATVFQSATVETLSREVEALMAPSNPASVASRAPHENRNMEHPLSRSQRRLWFLNQLDPANAVYNIAIALTIDGPLKRDVVERSLKALVERHESLRTRFLQKDGVPYSIVEDARDWQAEFVDYSFLPPDMQQDEILRFAQEAARDPFSLDRGSLFRATLLRKSPDQHVIVLVMHHIISDGWSLGVLAKELGTVYQSFARGREYPLEPLQFQFRDFVTWEQRESELSYAADLEYWRQQLAGELPLLELPADHVRPSLQTFNGQRVSTYISADLADQLQKVGRGQNATFFMVLLATFKVLLHQYSGQEDILLGTPTAGRLKRDFEGLVGFFVNNLVLRTGLSGNPSFAELVARVRKTSLEAFEHQSVPFDQLVEVLQPDRSLDRSPIFQVMFTLQNTPLPRLRLDDLEMKPLEFQSLQSRYDISVDVYLFEGKYRCDFEYNTDIYEEETVLQMQRHYLRLLKTVASAPATPIRALSLLNESERSQIVEGWNRTSMPASPSATVAEWLQAQAVKTPAAAAVIYGERTLTYAELDAQSNKLASTLRSHGVARGTVVGVFLHRSPEMVVALLGILKAGGAYLPLDPQLPAQRIEFLIADAAVPLIITQTDLRDTLSDSAAALLMIDQIGESVEQPPTDKPNSEDLAYLIYTSGSTGNPKGTEITHGALVNLLASMLREPGLTSEDTLVAVTTLSFDIAGLEIFGPLVCGATVVVASREQVLDPELLACLLEESAATVMQATPSTWRMLVESGWMGGADLRMWCGGEALRPDLAESLLARGRELWNLYGPTETTIWSAAHRVKSGENPILIGRPIGNTRMYILDPAGQPVPVGVPGELYIAGAGVARAYWRRPELTETRFLPDPFDPVSGRRMYRTGDLARYRRDGQIQLIGRTDHQIKLRGHRIELGEIEVVIERHPEVLQAVVALHGEGNGQQLMACIKQSGDTMDTGNLRSWLQERLPDYMVPSSFIAIEEIPLTPNGKVDRKQLPKPKASTRETLIPIASPRNRLEEKLVQIWSEILGVDRVGVRDNFFDLGGHSLLLIRVHARLRQELDSDVAVIDLFRYPTIESMASWLNRRSQSHAVAAGANA